MKTEEELKRMRVFIRTIASSIIETQEAMKDLTDETEQTLETAGTLCLALEKMIDELIQPEDAA